MKKATLRIRKITIKDLDIFFALFSRILKTEFPEYSIRTKEFMIRNKNGWNKKKYRKWILDSSKFILGAWKKGKLVGVFEGETMVGGVSLCTWIMVDPDFQKQGIGKKILQAWESVSLKKGIHSLFLYSTKKNIPFYTKAGFELSGVHKKGWFGSDDYMLTKLIQEPKEENFLR